jgi:TM2 domain
MHWIEAIFADIPLSVKFGVPLVVIIGGLSWIIARANRGVDAWAGSERLSTEQLAIVEQRIANENKGTALAYVLWFFIGTLGIHNFYIGRSILGLAELILGFGGFVLLTGA